MFSLLASASEECLGGVRALAGGGSRSLDAPERIVDAGEGGRRGDGGENRGHSVTETGEGGLDGQGGSVSSRRTAVAMPNETTRAGEKVREGRELSEVGDSCVSFLSGRVDRSEVGGEEEGKGAGERLVNRASKGPSIGQSSRSDRKSRDASVFAAGRTCGIRWGLGGCKVGRVRRAGSPGNERPGGSGFESKLTGKSDGSKSFPKVGGGLAGLKGTRMEGREVESGRGGDAGEASSRLEGRKGTVGRWRPTGMQAGTGVPAKLEARDTDEGGEEEEIRVKDGGDAFVASLQLGMRRGTVG